MPGVEPLVVAVVAAPHPDPLRRPRLRPVGSGCRGFLARPLRRRSRGGGRQLPDRPLRPVRRHDRRDDGTRLCGAPPRAGVASRDHRRAGGRPHGAGSARAGRGGWARAQGDRDRLAQRQPRVPSVLHVAVHSRLDGRAGPLAQRAVAPRLDSRDLHQTAAPVPSRRSAGDRGENPLPNARLPLARGRAHPVRTGARPCGADSGRALRGARKPQSLGRRYRARLGAVRRRAGQLPARPAARARGRGSGRPRGTDPTRASGDRAGCRWSRQRLDRTAARDQREDCAQRRPSCGRARRDSAARRRGRSGSRRPHAAFARSAMRTRSRRIVAAPRSRCSGFSQSSNRTTFMSGRTRARGPCSRM